jgi:hypothetical protein
MFIVAVEDLVLAVLVLHRDGELGLAQLACVAGGALGLLGRLHALRVLFRVGVLRQHVLHVLLRERGTALLGGREHVVHRGTGDALDVHAGMLVEPVVLHRHGGVLHLLRDLVEGHLLAVLPVELRDE